MNEKDSLQQLFADFRPELGDGEDFMQALARRLEAVEYVKQMQDARIRRYKYAVLLALLCGLAAGGILCAVVLMQPAGAPVFSFGSQWLPLLLLERNSQTISLVSLSILLSVGVVMFVNMLNEIPVNRKKKPAKQTKTVTR